MHYSMVEWLGIFLITALVVTGIGFIRTVWFISLGYSAAIAVFVLLVTFLFHQRFVWFHWLQNLALLVWAVRLGFFLLLRERNVHYTESVSYTTRRSQALRGLLKIAIWVSVCVLYVCMFSPALFAAHEYRYAVPVFPLIAGSMLMLCGVFIEGVADQQKSAFKAQFPRRFCNKGLFAWVRFPNYLGEILVWVGNFLVGVPFYTSLWYWLISGTGLVCIVLIMIGSAKRLEAKQNSQYGTDPAYQTYIGTVPVLFPWVRLYSLKNVRVYLG